MKPGESEIEAVVSRLRELAAADATKQAPPRVEAGLLRALSGRRSGRSLRYAWALAAAAVVLFIVSAAWVAQRRTPKKEVAAAPLVAPVARVEPGPVAVEPVKPRLKQANPRPAEEDALAGFIALVPGNPFGGEEASRLVRVKLPRSALVSFGLPVNGERVSERVDADVLLGEDGSPRAIRLVSTASFR
jgi:hypothetical protein